MEAALTPYSTPYSEAALIYCRVSDPRQADEGNSLATQERQAREYARRHGLAVARVFVERGESAKTDARPVLREMLAYCAQHQNDVRAVIIPKIDRLARNAHDYANLKLQLRRLGVRVESVGERIEDTPVGRFTETILASVAQFDNEIRAERCKGGMVEAVKAGRWVWKAPRGYRNVRVNGKANIEPDPVEGPVVREAFERLAAGHQGVTEVCRWMRSRGILLTPARLHEIVDNRAYTGVIASFGLVQRAAPPFVPLVPEETFLRARARVRSRRGRAKGYEKYRPDFPLRGTLRCACGRLLTGCWCRGRSGRYAYYRCSGCRRVNYARDAVEAEFEAELSRFAPVVHPDHPPGRELRAALDRRWRARHAEASEARGRLEKAIEAKRALRKSLALKSAQGVLPDDLAREQIAEVTLEVRDLEERREALPLAAEETGAVLDFALRFLGNMSGYWRSASPENRRNLQSFLYPDGLIYTKEGGFRTADYPLLEEIKGGSWGAYTKWWTQGTKKRTAFMSSSACWH